ncbi:MAG: antitoxin Xre/MbcA/ParS toxin-binding domain-containing protein [Pseudomonadota bacterium]|nr:antitoxin Xre/MbcA/ParS toxin-binding domain-containing protein [Pseudomonadota bacterium]
MVRFILIDTAPRPLTLGPITPEEAVAGFHAVARLFTKWGVPETQAAALLDMPKSTYRRWCKEGPGRISRDRGMRLGILLGIHKALRILFREPSRGYAWIRKPNADFGGRSALDIMMNGYITDLMRVRDYLDAERNGQ